MKSRSGTKGLLGLLAVGLAVAAPLAAQEGDVAEGSRVYGNSCGGCHNARSPLERTDGEWVTIVNHMRVRANLTGRQARSVLAFLQASNTDPAAARGATPAPETLSDEVPTDPALITQGEQLVAQKACIGCHLIGGAGGNVGPSLDRVVANKGARFVRQKLTDPTFNNGTSMMPNFGLTPQEIDALVAYLASIPSPAFPSGEGRDD